MCGLDPVWSRCFVSLWKRTLHWEFGIAFSCLCGLLLSPWRNCSKISVVRGYYKAKFNWFPTRAKEHTMVNINSATLTLDNSSHRSPSHAMVKYNWVLSWVFCPSPSSFWSPRSSLGITLSFACAFVVQDAGDVAVTYAVEPSKQVEPTGKYPGLLS